MKKSTAWLLDFGETKKVAVGERELLHLLPQPELFDVPLASAYCARVLSWQERLLPVWDLGVWFGDDPDHRPAPLAAVIGYQAQGESVPSFGALLLAEPPQRIEVGDEQFCELPDGLPWPAIAASCFRHGEQAVPILDLAVMFSAANLPAVLPEKSDRDSVMQP